MKNNQREIKFRAWDREIKKMTKPFSPWQMADALSIRLFDGRMIPMQYTGLKDKNGKEIYEGDIVSNNLKEQGIVKWEGIGFDWGDDFSKGKGDTDEIEVIGNIYENPELLIQ